jgi:hypothetical protein
MDLFEVVFKKKTPIFKDTMAAEVKTFPIFGWKIWMR